MKVRVKEKSFIGNTIVNEGDIIDIDMVDGGELSSNLEPLEQGESHDGAAVRQAKAAQAKPGK